MSENVVVRGRGQAPRRAQRIRGGVTTRFAVADQKGYLTTTVGADGVLDGVSLRIAKQGSTLAGMMDALGQAVTEGLRAGAPLDEYVAAFTNSRFVPAGRTDDDELPLASSVMDYVGRRLAIDHLPRQRRVELGVLTAVERRAQLGTGDGETDLVGLSMSAPAERA